jgi:uncharacterized protein involved in cysteine biosynthesis
MKAFGVVFAAVLRAFQDLARGGVLVHLLWPPMVSLGLWLLMSAFYWTQAHAAVLGWLPAVPWSGWQWLGDLAAGFLLATTLFAAIYCTTLILVGAVSLPLMMARIAARDYPDLGRHGGNAFWSSLANTLAAGAIFAVGWLLTLPLLLIPGVVLVLPLAWTAWLNQRAFRFDALAEHATAKERERLFERERGSFAMGGVVTAFAAAVPVVNLLAPGFAALVLCIWHWPAAPAPGGRSEPMNPRTRSGFGALIIGDEIVRGKRKDKHFEKLAELLATRGLHLAWVQYIGDDRSRLVEALRRSFASDDVVFSFGGIGATPDDHTRQSAAAALGVELVLHPDAEREIRARMVEMNYDVTPAR